MPYGSMLHIPLTSLLLLVAKQKPHKKAYLLTRNTEEFSEKSSEWASKQKKDRTERVRGLGRKTREEIVKWNQMRALRLQTGGRHQDILGLPSRGNQWNEPFSLIQLT